MSINIEKYGMSEITNSELTFVYDLDLQFMIVKTYYLKTNKLN